MGSDISHPNQGNWSEPRHMMPMLPTMGEMWSDKASKLIQACTRLDAAIPPSTRRALQPILRLVNCYYSNLIEGHRTFPAEVYAAMAAATSGRSPQKKLVSEAIAHIQVQSRIDSLIQKSFFHATEEDVIRWMHKEFIDHLPESMRWTESRKDGSKEAIVPGEYRQVIVQVGDHIPISPEHIPVFMDEFHKYYKDHEKPSPESVARIAAAHQRFMWIHPFIDANGRAGRLMTDSMLAKAGLSADGLWRISRGFARRNDDYKRFLHNADVGRQGPLDGRCNLSQKGMDEWCDFFLDVALDQVDFMSKLLHIEMLSERITTWAKNHFSSKSAHQIGLLLDRIVFKGSVSRADAFAQLFVTERHARRIIHDLEKDGFIATNSAGELLPSFPLSLVPIWFPELFPSVENEGLHKSTTKVLKVRFEDFISELLLDPPWKKDREENIYRQIALAVALYQNEFDQNSPPTLADGLSSLGDHDSNALLHKHGSLIDPRNTCYVRPSANGTSTQPLLISNPARWRDGRSLVAFCDGHTAWFSPEKSRATWQSALTLTKMPKASLSGIEFSDWLHLQTDL